MHGLTRVQEKHTDDTLERDTRLKGEKLSGLTMSVQRCALVLLYRLLRAMVSFLQKIVFI